MHNPPGQIPQGPSTFWHVLLALVLQLVGYLFFAVPTVEDEPIDSDDDSDGPPVLISDDSD